MGLTPGSEPSGPRDALMAADQGPIVALSLHVAEGSIGLEAAKAEAAEHGAQGRVTANQLITLAETAMNVAWQGHWRRASELAELCYEAARAAHEVRPADMGYIEAWAVAAADLVEVVHGGLFEAGDIRLYLRAREVTEAALKVCQQLELGSLVGLLSMRFGTLLVDAYTANRTSQNYELQFGEWVARALQAGDPSLITLLNQRHEATGRGGWPDPLDGLREAEQQLRTALPLLNTTLRGSVLKALSQAIEWQGMLGAMIDPGELQTITDQALEAIEPDDANSRLALMATLQRLEGDAESAPSHSPVDLALIERLESDLTGYIAETSEISVWSGITQAVGLLASTDPVRALRLLQRHRELPDPWSNESLRQRHFDLELTVFVEAYNRAPIHITDVASFEHAADTARASAARAATSEDARAAAAELVYVLRVSSGVNREEQALGLLDVLGSLDMTLWADHQEALAYLVATLWRGAGVNQWEARAADEAGRLYCRAADAYRRVGITVQMVQCLRDLRDVVEKASSVLDELTAWLVTGCLEFERAAPSSAPAAVQDLAARLMAAQVAAGTSTEVVQMLLQVSKGRRFATMLTTGTREFAPGPTAFHLLALVAEAEARLPPESELLRPTPFDDALGDDERMTAWVDEYEEGPSETAADRLGNLQRSVERQLTAALMPAAAGPVALVAQIQARLDSRTALVQLFEGVSIDGRLASWQLLLTRDFAHLAGGVGQLPAGVTRASWRGRTVTMPLSGMWVGALRRAVQADPGPLDVAPEATGMLTSAYDRYLRVIDQCCEPLNAAGVDRLVVVPHAVSRFLPLHLTGPAQQPLVDSWTVTYLSNLAQLMGPLRPVQRREEIGVFALSYADQPRLPRLDDSAAEADAIAAACGTTPIMDAAATEAAFRQALQTCRYVHLRAHGRMFVDAPSFHTVFLHPSEQDDGRLRAYEVLPLDLAGLELVTLGACETGLVRVDPGDNPRGLPAALVLAGAQAVIGTIWPVLAPASKCFFTELYRTLMHGDEDVRGAFAAAQRLTRDRFPQYRDWGAFYLIGGVNSPNGG